MQMCYSVREGGKEEEETEPPFIDWKRTFRDLFGVMSRIKAVVLKAGLQAACVHMKHTHTEVNDVINQLLQVRRSQEAR